MTSEELFRSLEVELTASLDAILSRPGSANQLRNQRGRDPE